ncbi:hypothetical protein NV379_03205 [Paenibacillus sp. N1-5-1-14]|uniref:hypothetical protein n=1 Tax=Paenibacillus radicibacter TaxID=2972488 RepID=UPI00215958A7|nr:hypothetical protein [Paenibacillus radicibacter]MCR8641655.1 hypothetical protein [Paenibacillus radicibacter]
MVDGDDNPAIILWFFAIPTLIVYIGMIVIAGLRDQKFIRVTTQPFYLLMQFLLLEISIYGLYRKIVNVFGLLEGRVENTHIINAYTNDVFINSNTFIIAQSFT